MIDPRLFSSPNLSQFSQQPIITYPLTKNTIIKHFFKLNFKNPKSIYTTNSNIIKYNNEIHLKTKFISNHNPCTNTH